MSTRSDPVRTDTPVRHLVLVLGDQLSPGISSLSDFDAARDAVLMVEVMEEATYVAHHKKKIAFLFSAMRHFADDLRRGKFRVIYRTLDDTGPRGSLSSEVDRAVGALRPARVIVTEPGEWRVLQMMRDWQEALGVQIDIRPDSRFLASHEEFQDWARRRKQLRMEYFYREMRRKTGLLMDGGAPAGGKWNYDAENRKPAKTDLFMPPPFVVEPDPTTREVLALVAQRFAHHFGDLEPFGLAVTRRDALRALDHFIQHALPRFGDFQDAMLEGEPLLYHSLLSPYLNCGLLDPLEICGKAESAWRSGKVPLNAAEGFIRQIIGWREYVRGIYWLRMPGYAQENHFHHDRPVPEFYWTGDTGMACLAAAIGQTKALAYAHHIQRLMVTGNFALLAGVSPQALHEWYLIVYADAYEWVELPNTLGMSQFADGGLLASKPYAASGAYIDRMSDYCKGCRYQVTKRTGDDACPFNALYWDFMARHRKLLEKNPRIGRIYGTWDKFADKDKSAIRDRARDVIGEIFGSG